MLTLTDLPLHWTIAFIVIGAAVVAWGLTAVLKLGLQGYLRAHEAAKTPWYWDAGLRLFSIVAGAAVGMVAMANALGLILGASSGALSALIVWLVKRRIRKLAGAEVADLPPPIDITIQTIPPRVK